MIAFIKGPCVVYINGRFAGVAWANTGGETECHIEIEYWSAPPTLPPGIIEIQKQRIDFDALEAERERDWFPPLLLWLYGGILLILANGVAHYCRRFVRRIGRVIQRVTQVWRPPKRAAYYFGGYQWAV